MEDIKRRCFGNRATEKKYAAYHDTEWGIPVYDDTKLFEMLILEGAQAGISFRIVLDKREGYKKAFHQYNPAKVAQMSDDELALLSHNKDIIRNRLKIASARTNARAFVAIQKEYGSFAKYAWQFVDNQPRLNEYASSAEVPTFTKESLAFSKDLKARGMKFVGEVIMYAYMQSVGMMNDHIQSCWCYARDRQNIK